MKRDDDLVLYFGHGAMAGVFSAGVAAEFSKANLIDRVHSIYGNSAGALTALCFLSDQSEMGAKLYSEDLSGDQYIRWRRLPGYLLRGLSNKILRTRFTILPIFDIDYIEKILSTTRKIDYRAIEAKNIPLHMIAYNIKTHRHDYLTVTEEKNMLRYLRASAGAQPAYPHATAVGSRRYIDGAAISDSRRIDRVVGNNPTKTVVCIMNGPSIEGGPIKRTWSLLMMAVMMFPFFSWKEVWRTMSSDYGTIDSKELQELFPHVHFVSNQLSGLAFTTDPKDHERLYRHGQDMAKKFLQSPEYKNIQSIC